MSNQPISNQPGLVVALLSKVQKWKCQEYISRDLRWREGMPGMNSQARICIKSLKFLLTKFDIGYW